MPLLNDMTLACQRLREAEGDPYSFAITNIADILRMALSEDIVGAMNDVEHDILNDVLALIVTRDPAVNIDPQ